MACPNPYDLTDPALLVPDIRAVMPDVSAAAGEMHARYAAKEFFRRSEVWRSHRLTLPCTPGQTRYPVPAPVDDGRISRVTDLYMVGPPDIELERNAEIGVLGRQAWFSPSPDTVILHQDPGEGCVLRLRAALVPGDDHRVEPSQLQRWADRILSGALYRAARTQKGKSRDTQLISLYLTEFETGVAEAERYYGEAISTETPRPTRTQRAIQMAKPVGTLH